MKNMSPSDYGLGELLGICAIGLDRFASCKKNFVRRNYMPFKKRNLDKTHMKRNRSRNQSLKTDLAPVRLPIINSEIIVCLFCKKLKGIVFLVRKKEALKITNNSGEL